MKDLILRAIAPRPRPAAGATLQPGVTLYGDSIMHGGIAAVMADAGCTGVIHDRSVPGDTAANAWRRMPYELRATTHVVLQQGTNDLTVGADPVQYLRRMVRYLRAEGRTVILTGIAQRADRPTAPTDLDVRRLAITERVAFAGWGVVPLNAPDGLHPGPEMARALAQRLLWVLGSGDL